MTDRTDGIVTALVLVSVICAAAMVALFARGDAYAGTCTGLGACYCTLLAMFLVMYAEVTR